MTEWDIETLEGFDGTNFDDGTGWKLVFQIHMGISVRAKMTQHPIRIGNFATQVRGLVWTGDYEVPGFQDLPTRLREGYAAIESLLSSNENIRWTEASGRSSEWTIESLIADIGMGEFEPLLRPQAPEPFVWLIAALNRLTHPKLKRSLNMQQLSFAPGDPGLPGLYYRDLGSDEIVYANLGFVPGAFDDDDLWNGMAYHPDSGIANISRALVWQSTTSPPGYRAVGKTKYISLIAKKDTGEALLTNENWFRFLGPSIVQVDYNCTYVKISYTGPSWTVKIGTSADVPISSAGTYVVESLGPDLDFEGTKTVAAELITERPDYCPFILIAGVKTGQTYLSMNYAWVYCDLPEVMGVGELTAPIPVTSGEAEWEE